MARSLTVYLRHGCHLCTEMTQALERLRPELGFEFTAIDIDTSPDLLDRYDTLVPVLVGDGAEICHYFLEENRLRCYLQAGDG